MLRRTALAALVTAPLTPVRSAPAEPSGDVQILRRAFELLHPGLLRYCAPRDVQANLAQLQTQWQQDDTLAGRYLALSRFATTVRCGHTYANFYNQTKEVANALFERSDCLPFYFKWVQGRMIVTRSLQADLDLPSGTEVMAINGVPVTDLLPHLMSLARADGSNDGKRLAWLQVQGEDSVEAFDVFEPLCFPRTGSTVFLELRTPQRAEVLQREVVTMTAAERRRQRTQSSAELPWSLDLSDPALAVLRMSTWALYNSKWNWHEWLDQSFATLASKNVPALAIDLRANEGGLDVGDVLLSYLVDAPIRLPTPLRLVRYRQVPDDLLPYLDTWDPSFHNWGDKVERFDSRFFRFKEDSAEALGTISPRKPRFRGRVFVLVGPTNSSATFEFASRIQGCRRGLLVGEPTGGNLRGINGGAFFFLRLPATGLEIDLPLIGQFPSGPTPPDRGLQPDVLVRPAIDDIAKQRDVVMDVVRALASRS